MWNIILMDVLILKIGFQYQQRCTTHCLSSFFFAEKERERRKKCMMRWWKKTPFFLLECLYKNYHVNDGKVCCVYVNQQTRGLRPSIKWPKIHWKIFLDVRHCLPYCDEIRFPLANTTQILSQALIYIYGDLFQLIFFRWVDRMFIQRSNVSMNFQKYKRWTTSILYGKICVNPVRFPPFHRNQKKKGWNIHFFLWIWLKFWRRPWRVRLLC